MRVGIDASNLRSGGTITHVVELLGHGDPRRHGITQVTLWAPRAVAERAPVRSWLETVHVPALDRSLPRRVAWQVFERSRLARAAACDVLFAPGATPAGSFRPYVSMSANMMPFDSSESARYGWSRDRVRLMLLHRQQSRAFHDSSGVIFLTDFARQRISAIAGLPSDKRVAVIPSGVNDRFRAAPRPARPLDSYSNDNPFRFLYISDIHPYKHPWHVATAVARMRRDGLPVALDLIGFPIHKPSTRTLETMLGTLNGGREAVRFSGGVPHDTLPPAYREADAFIFASTCENLPMTLVEAMAAGLPIAASQTPPMPQILGDAAVLFDAEQMPSIEKALRQLATSPQLRATLAERAYNAATRYSWDDCSDQTFAMLAAVVRERDTASR